MKNEDFPALFLSSDAAAEKYQKIFLSLVGGEYFLLSIASILSLSVFTGGLVYLASACVFITSLIVLMTRSMTKPEQDWYKCRALAESVKTLTWRYVMRATPFHDDHSGQGPRGELRENLERIFSANQAIAEKIDENWSAMDQITAEMERIRALPLGERKSFYQLHRIADQRGWYHRKAIWNRRNARRWVWIAAAAYVVATALTLARIRFADWAIWPIEPFIVVASSILGWTQIKKFNELSAAYTVTAHEIGLIHLKLDPAATETNLSEVVNEAELAFSREHTLWIARQAH